MSWSVAWIIWLTVAAFSFAVLEWVTFRRHETLSENVRRWLGVDPRRPWRRIAIPAFIAVMLGFTAWFVPHITL